MHWSTPMIMQSLLNLPIKVTSDVFGRWLPLKSVVWLTAASKHSPHEEKWLDLMAQKEFAFHSIVDCSEENVVPWLLENRLKVSNIKFSLEPEYQHIAEFLRKCGPSLTAIECLEGLDEIVTLMLATYCRNITKLIWHARDIPSSFRDVLISCSKIQELRLFEVDCADPEVFTDLSLHSLRTLTLWDNASIRENVPWSVSTFSESLTVLELNHHLVSSAVRLSMIRNCPQLTALRITGMPESDAILSQTVTMRPALLHLDISHNAAVTDQGIFDILYTLHHLRSLNIQHCKALTNLAVAHVAQGRGNTLTTIYMDIKNPDAPATELVIAEFGQKCIKLQYLNVNCGEHTLDKSTCAYSLIHGCPALQTLVINKNNAVGNTTRRFTRDARPKLRILHHSENTMYNIHDMPI